MQCAGHSHSGQERRSCVQCESFYKLRNATDQHKGGAGVKLMAFFFFSELREEKKCSCILIITVVFILHTQLRTWRWSASNSFPFQLPVLLSRPHQAPVKTRSTSSTSPLSVAFLSLLGDDDRIREPLFSFGFDFTAGGGCCFSSWVVSVSSWSPPSSSSGYVDVSHICFFLSSLWV